MSTDMSTDMYTHIYRCVYTFLQMSTDVCIQMFTQGVYTDVYEISKNSKDCQLPQPLLLFNLAPAIFRF